jgi:phosphopantothenoylcysteine synthetase/decarboxylase
MFRAKSKNAGVPIIELTPTRDILASLGALPEKKFLLVGFAAETENLEKNARDKLTKKRCDVVIANDVSASGLGFESEENALTILLPDRISRVLPRASKRDLAIALVKILCEIK